jgi:hypothetical protein
MAMPVEIGLKIGGKGLFPLLVRLGDPDHQVTRDPRSEPREYILTAGGLCNGVAPSSHKEECAVMDQQRDREQLERKLEQCRRLSGAASDPTTSIRFAKLIEELEHSLREAE